MGSLLTVRDAPRAETVKRLLDLVGIFMVLLSVLPCSQGFSQRQYRAGRLADDPRRHAPGEDLFRGYEATRGHHDHLNFQLQGSLRNFLTNRATAYYRGPRMSGSKMPSTERTQTRPCFSDGKLIRPLASHRPVAEIMNVVDQLDDVQQSNLGSALSGCLRRILERVR